LTTAGLTTSGLTTPRLTSRAGLADQAVRHLLDGHLARRLGRDPVQYVG
jgi:hypothetical protein